jgi:signal transduction histidine kinase
MTSLIARRRALPIATRLFYSAAVWSTVLLVLTGLALTATYRRSTEQALDDRLGVYLRALVADIATPGDDSRTEPGQLGEPRFELALSGWYWQIMRVDAPGEIKASRSLFASQLPRLSTLGVRPELGGLRRGEAPGPDEKILRMVERVIDIGDGGIYLVQVAAPVEEIDKPVRDFEITLAIAFVLLGLGLVLVTALQVRFGLRPLRTLRQEVTEIRRGEKESISGSFPEDLAPLAGELNLLIASNRDVVERSRTHVGNLAHALKTPLSVIINEVGAEESPIATKVREQAAIMRDQVSYYLDRARAAARSSVIGSVCDVAPVLQGLVRTFEKIYRDRQVAFHAECPDAARFRGERQDLEEMIGNLVDNAGKWAASRVDVNVTLQQPLLGAVGTPVIVVTIDDDGPGLPPDQREAALARGRRLDETRAGSGLGLSIVADLVQTYSGKLSLEDGPLGGLRSVLRLPAAEAA